MEKGSKKGDVKKQKNDVKNQKSVDEILMEKDRTIAQYKGQIDKMRLDSMLDEKLRKSRAKNTVAVRALLDMDAIKEEGGKLLGVDEQIAVIKAKDNYLFEGAYTGGGANPSHVQENIDFDSLSDEEYFKIKFKE